MNDPLQNVWPASLPDSAPVPPRYCGVWQRTLLQTPELQDETTFVRWMQLGRWHVDLRIPLAARAGSGAFIPFPYNERLLAQLTKQQGFCGVTQVEVVGQDDVCTWHRLVDYQPPSGRPDAGHMIFDGPNRVIETGIHGVYREIWHRLPLSAGRFIALAEPLRADKQPSTRLFLARNYLMRVKPLLPAWQPAFEISFGLFAQGQWQIQKSTRPELEGQCMDFTIHRLAFNLARVSAAWAGTSSWQILEWTE